jgi:hypothetical protein
MEWLWVSTAKRRVDIAGRFKVAPHSMTLMRGLEVEGRARSGLKEPFVAIRRKRLAVTKAPIPYLEGSIEGHPATLWVVRFCSRESE